MATKMLQRRGTAAEWAAANEVLGEGAIGLEEDTDIIKMGDGVTPWNDLGDDRVYIPLDQQDARYVARDLVDAAGDILVATGDKTLDRLPRGTAGSRLTILPDLTLAWVDLPPAANPFTGVDAAGDLLVGSAPDTVARLPVGANGKVLGVVGGLPAWMTPAGADLSTVVAKAGDTMTGQLKMLNVPIRFSPGADAATDPRLWGAANLMYARKADGSYCPFDAGALYDTGNRVYSASNPPPVSGMSILGGVQSPPVTASGGGFTSPGPAGTYNNNVYDAEQRVTFTAPASGKVKVTVTAAELSTYQGFYVAFRLSTEAAPVSLNTYSHRGAYLGYQGGGNGISVATLTGLSPGASYTLIPVVYSPWSQAAQGQGTYLGGSVTVEG